jgi:hypothetical protein
MRTCRTSLVSRSFMTGTTRTGRDGSREGCRRVHVRNLNARDLARTPTANFAVRYIKSLTVGVKKTNFSSYATSHITIVAKCEVANELTNRTYGEKKWWVVTVKDH